MNYQFHLNNKQFKEALNYAEHEVILSAFAYTRYNQVRTAQLLGISRGTLRSRLKLYGELI